MKVTTNFRLAYKLRALKSEIKKWTKEVGDKMEVSTLAYINHLTKLGILEVEGPLCARDREKRGVVKREMAYYMNLDTNSWRQKVREKWLKKGDRNTKYFHCMEN